jgi:hypothetical protein
VLAAGLLIAAGLGLFLYVYGAPVLDAGPFGVALVVASCLAIVLAIAVVVVASGDLRSDVEMTGPILRLRALGDDDEEVRHYLAVDDGVSDRIRAWRIREELYRTLEQGETVTVTATPRLGCVRLLLRRPGPE